MYRTAQRFYVFLRFSRNVESLLDTAVTLLNTMPRQNTGLNGAILTHPLLKTTTLVLFHLDKLVEIPILYYYTLLL